MILESTPCTILFIKPHGNSKDKTEHVLKLYWSANKGIYGYQIGYEIYESYKMVDSGTTGGCGYCKESHAFGQFLRRLNNGKYARCGGTVGYYLNKFKKGGNYYECTKAQLFKATGNS